MFPSVILIAGGVSKERMARKSLDIYDIAPKKPLRGVLKVIQFLYFQIATTCLVIRMVKRGTKTFFWIADSMILPFLAAKLKGGEIYYFIYGNVNKIRDQKKTTKILSRCIIYMANHATNLCMEDTAVMDEWDGVIDNDTKKIIHLFVEPVTMARIEKADIIGMVCRVSEGKYVPESINAFLRFIRLFPGWKLEIIGSGPQQELCRKIIQENDADAYIKMFGWIPNERIPGMMARWKYFLLPTDTEGLPSTLLEAMNLGIPCLASPVGAIKNIIKDGENGWILRKNGITGIYDGMCRLARPNTYDEISRSAERTVRERYSLCAAERALSEAIRK